jgi:hypothetical protein
MANGHPKIGGTYGVPELDLGQIGGTRETAGTAKLTAHVIVGQDNVNAVTHKLPQSIAVYRNVIGFVGGRIVIQGVMRASTAAIFETMLQEINQRRHGSLRNGAGGPLLPPDPSKMVPTQVTDSQGTVISQQAVVQDWQPRGRRLSNSEWDVIQEFTLTLEKLG